MGNHFSALDSTAQSAITSHVRAEYDRLISLHPPTYVAHNTQSDPESWQDNLCELIAADSKRVQAIAEYLQRKKDHMASGFTLIELSIVLVIIGLIVGGILTGQELIRAAGVRATIAQIEKYQTAVNTFRVKYGALPGDLDAQIASQFGFTARGTKPGQGDGNGVIEGTAAASHPGFYVFNGENAAFWVDLSTANGLKVNLVDGGFTAGASTITGSSGSVASTAIKNYLPEAKLGDGNFIYSWSGGWAPIMANKPGDSLNYFGLSAVSGGDVSGYCYSNVSLTVAQAYSIDKKTDDGLPQSGNVLAMYAGIVAWAAGGPPDPFYGSFSNGSFDVTTGGPITSQTSSVGISYDPNGDPLQNQYLCYGNGIAGAGPTSTNDGDGTVVPQVYETKINNGAGHNCALSFRFQ